MEKKHRKQGWMQVYLALCTCAITPHFMNMWMCLGMCLIARDDLWTGTQKMEGEPGMRCPHFNFQNEPYNCHGQTKRLLKVYRYVFCWDAASCSPYVFWNYIIFIVRDRYQAGRLGGFGWFGRNLPIKPLIPYSCSYNGWALQSHTIECVRIETACVRPFLRLSQIACDHAKQAWLLIVTCGRLWADKSKRNVRGKELLKVVLHSRYFLPKGRTQDPVLPLILLLPLVGQLQMKSCTLTLVG